MSLFFLILQFILAAVITVAVLLQKSSSIGLGAYSGSNESLFGAKGPAGFLAKFTFSIGVLFIINTLILGYTYNTDMKRSIVDSIDTKALMSIDVNKSVPSVPSVPTTPATPAQ
ncbi:preprotein translocase subunit SecG [Campylobacter sp. faydin G-24]|uniref:Protein-export membrane protein SecG n=1 Tax=Campylobacter anatolicus TaxID=2829105 RepID=A0ABS5HIT8_9BACT|nr:preprotein translocase subunit SecG [Campylobacter anatolicus]MBR8461535.1 preprotein translocase subunit SecG [Campylobacter anatolicus]MBR8464181.1 preprotein translocase subunit SecG [Campylobacter anatolicus]MBR8466087.1 preprotein translocase subunit SecG [Campylobacter anatolicus]